MSGNGDAGHPQYDRYEQYDHYDEPGPAETGKPERSTGGSAFLVGAIVAAAVVTFAFQNTQPVELHFLWFEGSLPLWVAMAFAVIGTAFVLVLLIGGSARKRRRQRRRATAAASASRI